jgi:hypothetical protein
LTQKDHLFFRMTAREMPTANAGRTGGYNLLPVTNRALKELCIRS